MCQKQTLPSDMQVNRIDCLNQEQIVSLVRERLGTARQDYTIDYHLKSETFQNEIKFKRELKTFLFARSYDTDDKSVNERYKV